MSWVPRQGNIPDFACLTIYYIARSPELFVCLTIYENAETLSHKDIAILDHYRPIALLNTIYQLIMLIITSRLRQLTEYYAVMEGSQYGFRTHRGVQMVVQRAHWVQQQAMKECGTLIRIDLDFKNAFNSAMMMIAFIITLGEIM